MRLSTPVSCVAIMTDHPLTDDVCQKIIDSEPGSKWGPEMIDCFVEDFVRAAYDKGCNDQLEKVIEWLEDCSICDTIIHRGESVLVEELRKAMRPQKQEKS